jgi:formamidopyrimidine-DNA glycosylase
MPELPEVQTTVSGLNRVLSGLVITDAWTEYNSKYFHGKDTIKDPIYFKYFKKTVKNSRILSVNRRAKNILINLSNNHTILIHMKMTGHVMYGDYNRTDPYNRFIRFILYLSNGKTMELCDTRKFAKVTLLKTDKMHETIHLKNIGPEPLEKEFTFELFQNQIYKKPKGKIKSVLLNQEIIAGIGNIYGDESLWRAGIHPEQEVDKIKLNKLKELYKAIRQTLAKGIDFGGDSMSDYRNIDGEKGKFQEQHRAYRKTGQKCMKKNCNGTIQRIVVGGRSSHFCSNHQIKEYN